MAVKRLVGVKKKSKIVKTYFVTEAIDLKTIR